MNYLILGVQNYSLNSCASRNDDSCGDNGGAPSCPTKGSCGCRTYSGPSCTMFDEQPSN